MFSCLQRAWPAYQAKKLNTKLQHKLFDAEQVRQKKQNTQITNTIQIVLNSKSISKSENTLHYKLYKYSIN